MEEFSTRTLVKTNPAVLAVTQILKVHPQTPEKGKNYKPEEIKNMLKSIQFFPS